MSSDAHNLHRAIMLACGHGDARLFRNNVGQGWVGKAIRPGDGTVVIYDPRPLHAGLCEGSSDLIGWRRVLITQEHVGKFAALFVAIEAKHGAGRLNAAQRQFLAVVQAAGGIAGEARSPAVAAEILKRGGFTNG